MPKVADEQQARREVQRYRQLYDQVSFLRRKTVPRQSYCGTSLVELGWLQVRTPLAHPFLLLTKPKHHSKNLVHLALHGFLLALPGPTFIRTSNPKKKNTN